MRVWVSWFSFFVKAVGHVPFFLVLLLGTYQSLKEMPT